MDSDRYYDVIIIGTGAGGGTLAHRLALLPLEERTKALFRLAPSPEDAWRLMWDWGFWARPEQLEPTGAWSVWLMVSGRGWGKNRTCLEWTRSKVESGRYGILHIVCRTAADYRDVIVHGPAGFLGADETGRPNSPPWFRPQWFPSMRLLVWPNGAKALLFAADEPDQLRGPQCQAAWADEIASWRYEEAWDNLELGCRLGPDPKIVAGTTPKPRALLKKLLADPGVHAVKGLETYDNIANLSPKYIARVIRKYENTRLARQELHGLLIEDNAGALWRREWIDRRRVAKVPELRRVVVGIDPPVSEEGAEAGIVAVGVARHEGDGLDHAYVLGDLSLHGSPAKWGRECLRAWFLHGADRLVAEVNQGGDMVVHTVRTAEYDPGDDAKPGQRLKGPNVAVRKIRAKRGKRVRAEPVAALYEQGRVHHVGAFAELEDQQCQWDPAETEESPDRVDGLVYAITELLLGKDVAWAL